MWKNDKHNYFQEWIAKLQSSESQDCELEKVSENTISAREIAKNPDTSPEILQELANSHDVTVRKNIAANPNTPPEVLWKLGEQFPQEILNNPIFDLLLLEKPNLVKEIPSSTLKSILKEDGVPISFLTCAVNQWDREILLAITMNPQTPKEALEKLLHRDNIEIVEAGQLHVNLAGEMNEGWDKVAKDKIIKMADFDKGREEDLQQLYRLGLIPEFLSPYLKKHGESLHIISAAEFYSNPPEKFQDEWLIARNHNTPIDILKQLANHKYYRVRLSVALNINSTFNILNQLANDPDYRVCHAVASNPNTPASLIEKLVTEKGNIIICHGAIPNPHSSTSILENFLTHSTATIRLAAAQEYLHRHPNKLPKVLEKFAAISTHYSIRFFALLHHQIPAKPLVENSKSTIWIERYAIAQNPNTPTDILHILAKDGNRIVRSAAKYNLQNRQ
ncbi:MAG TPA: hypothetical protein DEG17_21585 [Cyanobacteria bacterium UBA11149]|nr:hypothetical protein [Cyanobacteria bacterium UBA11367]HBE60722.1 hypothetical protein [Cyanobacteria bacterium UBA11366]HBK65453.1 hypothetical protein [Cyanobacteria bacterium UBA11166]HBR74481.1 hypothetical protein [Cyanobacteria bacterium UBA11159]HBS68279.1 hypothetical protein [Cyanobacteria bacterium UBA11153]HBW91380.1 hypothetical protein [Cyanobacteria bacterium UBA11149]HCA93585.1 hypothetical protein [Cyanobacteria bacterium UBA9226]